MIRKVWTLFVVAAAVCGSSLQAQTLVPTNSVWKFFRGVSEPTSPASAWRNLAFNDTGWEEGEAPIYYDRENVYRGRTALQDMYGNYTTVFMRRKFSVADPTALGPLELKFFVDDGFAVWINGTLVTNLNTSTSNFAYNTTASRTVSEPLQWVTYTLVDPWKFLRAGTNVIAVQAFNRPSTSSDFIVELELKALEKDTEAPRLLSVTPAPGGVLAELSSVTVTFSEPVRGMGFSDLLINDRPAFNMTGGGSTYTFEFEHPPYGPVKVAWDAGAAITDYASPANLFDASGTWSYSLVDSIAPTLASVSPPAGQILQALSEITLIFSEPVTGLDAGDLLLNNSAATNLTGSGNGPYKFGFAPAAPGAALVTFRAGHGVADDNGNEFNAGGWAYTVDPNFTYPPLRITEFLASTAGDVGLRDEDDELSDWVEIHNPTATAVNLAGWSLTDEEDELGKWVFPSVSIPAGGRLVVFASGKDRKPTAPGSRLHTNFKLSPEGEYLGLVAPSSPRAAVSFFANYPEQRSDYSYGYDNAQNLRYFAQPTPGTANGSSVIAGIVPAPVFPIPRGFYDGPVTMDLTVPMLDAEIRLTRDGSEPTATSGELYSGPLVITSNAVIRAAAFRANYLPSKVETHTYIFPSAVLRQPARPPGFPDVWIDTSSRSWEADYEMDPEVVDSPAYKDEMLAALRALPALSIVTDPEDMFDNTRGIYPKSQARGAAWERPASAEFIFHQEGTSVQIDCGVQMQGNSVRDPVKTAKHSFRLLFKGDYGPSKLAAQIFPDSPVKEFDTLTVRADFNTSWMHWNGSQRPLAVRVRDAFMKDNQRAMSGLSAHNRYFHLYVNGLYWGVYDPTERPDNSFGQSYFGGKKEDYDVVNEGQLVDGSMTAYNTMLAINNLGDNSQFELMKQYLDVRHHIDYMLLHFWAGHTDWFLNKNWYTLRRRAPGEGFKYIAWDGEMTLDSPNENRVTSTDTPSGLHTKLVANAEYRLQFADRVHKHFFNDGALTPARVIERFSNRIQQVDQAMVAESARWGDYRRDVHRYSSSPYVLYTRNEHFNAERNRLLTQYFPNRTGTVLNQLRNAQLYPATAAPTFNRHGGHVVPGHSLTMAAPSGTIYYTTNGADPRVAYSGEIAPAARVYSGALTISGDTLVKSRVRNGSEWSALNEAVFTVGSPIPKLAITELMHNPLGGSPYEFLEILNHGAIPIDVGTFSFEGITYNFPPATVIAPGEVLVLANSSSPASFAERYPGVRVFGYFDGNLNNGGERIALLDREYRTVTSVVYDDRGGWPREADGQGASLELVTLDGDPSGSGNWAARAGGSPGRADFAPRNSPVVINEILAAGPGPDWVELLNVSGSAVDLSGWRLSDSGTSSFVVFPTGTTIGPGAHLVVGTNLTETIALKVGGESLFLRDPNGAVMDSVSFGPQASGSALGRLPGEQGLRIVSPTPGAPNTPQAVGQLRDLVINEWLANSSAIDDFIEFYNRGSLPLDLRGLHIGANGQLAQLRAPTFVAPGGYLALYANEAGLSDSLDFKLSAAGDTIILLNELGAELNRLEFPAQAEGKSQGRLPDGSGTVVVLDAPSPGASNAPAPPRVTGTTLAGGLLTLELSAIAGQTYFLESSTDFTNWSQVQQITPSAPQFSVNVSLEEGIRGKFYRLRQGP